MLGIMGIGAGFMQAAGAHGEKVGKMELYSLTADPEISSITGTDIVVKTTKGGVAHEDTYASLESDTLSISADKNTKIVIIGTITECEIGENTDFVRISTKNTALTSLECNNCFALQELNLIANTALTSLECSDCSALQELNLSANTALTSLNCRGCYALQELNLSANTALTSLNCSDCYALQELNLSANTALTSLNCNNCYALQELNLSANTALTSLECNNCFALQELNLSANTALTSLECSDCYALQELNLSANTALTSLNCNNCSKIEIIYYPATNSDVSTAIAGAITNAESADGKVYTDSAADYYSTIADAATAKGWTIEQIQV